jgi:ketosteroid isomerase-like protein
VTAVPADNTLIDAVKHRESERQMAMIRADVPALEDIFAEDVTYIHSNGLAQTRSGLIAMLTKRELRYLNFDVEEADYREYGGTVVCTGMQSISLTSSGKPFTSNSRYTIVYATIAGRPRVVAYQSTLLPEIVKQEKQDTTRGE